LVDRNPDLKISLQLRGAAAILSHWHHQEISMSHLRAVAVFCGARPGNSPVFRAAATELGHGLARAGIRLIYGGGRVGLMGAIADAVLEAGGEVTGVIPEFLTRQEVAHDGVTEMQITDSMHTRKRLMFDDADAFVSFAGGLGTLDETFEILTWKQLQLHDKPILLTDIAGSARPLLATIEAAIEAGFAGPEVRDLFTWVDGVPETLRLLEGLSVEYGGISARL
jgi:uncharacterized protein (TIGR00730 family)